MLERYFCITALGSNLRNEVLGGVTTFVTMAYIIVVNPAILKFAGLPVGPSTVATILAAIFGCLLMGLYANRPIAVAPYMGENAFIAFTLSSMLIDGVAITWQERLGTVFVSGCAFLVLTLLGLRTWLAHAISPSMKHSFAVGIGLFLLLLGLYQTGIVTSAVEGMPVAALPVTAGNPPLVSKPPVPLKLGNVREPRVLLAIAGFLLTTVLMYWRVRGSILLAILAVAVVGYLLGLSTAPSAIVALPWDEAYDLRAIAGQLDIEGVLRLGFLPILLTLFLISFLDTLGTLVAVEAAANNLDEHGNPPDLEKPMLVDSLACMFSAYIGTSTSGAYIESVTGIKAGARTGLAAVVVALLFAGALFFVPLVTPLQALAYAYGPALMAVGILMVGNVVQIDFADLSETVPAVVTIAMMLFTYNIANGLTAGLLIYPLFKLATGQAAKVAVGSYVLGGLCAVYYLWGVPH